MSTALVAVAAVFVAAVLYAGTAFGVLALYLALGHRSLRDRARPVAAAPRAGDEEAAP